jgi:hypothetical protein
MNAVTLEQVEALAMQLSAAERLKLAARLCEKASTESSGLSSTAAPESKKSPEEVQQLLALVDAAAARWKGKFDAAEEIRQMREERDEQLWPSR